MTLKIIYKRMNEMKTDNMDFSQALLIANNEDMGNRAITFVNPLGGVQIGWLASQADMLAEDWQVKE